MKKILLSASSIVLSGIFAFGQTTATNFTAPDCNSVSHDLFTELNAGKVVVISFVMPCGACIGPSVTAYNTVQGYTSTYPGRVVFYVSSQGTCSTLTSWKNTNGMTNGTAFATATVTQSDYGGGGMPKVVVLGGTAHTVFYNMNSGVTTANLQTAINSALAATGISETDNSVLKLNVFPNPTTDAVSVSFTLTQTADVSLEIFNALGEKVKTIILEKQSAGKHESRINFEKALTNGNYFLKLSTSDFSHAVTFTVLN